MKPDMSKKINILHVIEFALSLAVAICYVDNDCINCGKHIVEMQFITASAFGILMFMSIIFYGLFYREEVGRRTDLCYNGLGGSMSLVSGILSFIYASKNAHDMKDYNYYRLLIGGCCFLLNGVIYLAESLILVFKKEKPEG